MGLTALAMTPKTEGIATPAEPAHNDREYEDRRRGRLQAVAGKLLDRAEEVIDGAAGAALSAQAMKQLSGVLKDIKDIQMLRAPWEEQEQALRLARLRQQLDEAKAQKLTVVLEGPVKDYGA